MIFVYDFSGTCSYKKTKLLLSCLNSVNGYTFVYNARDPDTIPTTGFDSIPFQPLPTKCQPPARQYTRALNLPADQVTLQRKKS